MMKITATAATPYSVVALTPEVTVVVDTLPETVIVVVEPAPGAVVVDTDVDTVVTVAVDVAVLVLDGAPVRVNAMRSPGVDPGHVEMPPAPQVPTGTMKNSWPLIEAPIDKPASIGAPT